MALEQLREGVRVGKRRDLGLEAGGRLGTVIAQRLGERALDGRALRGDLGNVAGAHLREEERAVGDAHARLRLRRLLAGPVVEGEQDDSEHDPPGARAEAGLGRDRRLG